MRYVLALFKFVLGKFWIWAGGVLYWGGPLLYAGRDSGFIRGACGVASYGFVVQFHWLLSIG